MLRRLLPIAAAVTLSAVAAPASAQTWMAPPGVAPESARIAVAITPHRTTTWIGYRFGGDGGPAAIVLAVPRGAAVDVASSAWLDALDLATPIAGGDEDPAASAVVLESVILASPDAVVAWGAERGLALPPSAQLAGAGERFFVARFDVPRGASSSPTLRLVAPASDASLPLALVAAADDPLPVTAWALAEGRGQLAVPTPDVTLEGSGRGTRALAEAYFGMAASGAGGASNASCMDRAWALLDADAPLGDACPEGALVAAACADRTLPGAFDVGALRCAGGDDLAVALSSAAPRRLWITRYAARVPAGGHGADSALTLDHPSVTPTRHAREVSGGRDSTTPGASAPTLPAGTQTGAGGEGAGGSSSDDMMPGDGDGSQPGDGYWQGSGNGPSDGSGSQSGNGSSSAPDLGDACDGDSSSDSSSCDGDSSSSCSGDSSSSCSGDSGGDCGSINLGDGGDCNCVIAGGVRAPRPMPVLMVLLALVAPLRRRESTRRRRARGLAA